jgi:hypothetical protein
MYLFVYLFICIFIYLSLLFKGITFEIDSIYFIPVNATLFSAGGVGV